MRFSWAHGAVAALTLTAAVGLLDTPSRLLGPASVAGNPLSLPRTSSPSIVIAAMPAPIVHAPLPLAPRKPLVLLHRAPPLSPPPPDTRVPAPVRPQPPRPNV
jgi:hypothetical protein